MPYRSIAQREFLHAQHPEIAERWDKKYGGKIMKSKKKPKDKKKPPKSKNDYREGFLRKY